MLGLTDIDGVLRGKFVSPEKFASLMTKDGGFCDCVFGWDMDDALYDGGAVTGWHTGFPDARYRLVAATERALAADGTPYFIGEFAGADGGDHPVCPRTLLRRVLDRAAGSALSAQAGFEYEFFVFRENAASVRDKGYRDMRPITPGNFGYSVLRAATNAEVFTGLMDYCVDFRMPLEGLHCETGPGVWEAALAIADGLESADIAPPCSRPSRRCSSSNATTSRRSWPSGRWTTRAKAATTTSPCSTTMGAMRSRGRMSRIGRGGHWGDLCTTSRNS